MIQIGKEGVIQGKMIGKAADINKTILKKDNFQPKKRLTNQRI